MASRWSTRAATRRLLTAAIVVLALAVASGLAATSGRAARRVAAPPLQLPILQSTSFVQNFNPFSAGALQSKAIIYEPLYIVSYVNNSKATPWLATSYRWSKDVKTLTFTMRNGVEWSDGQPLTAEDVYYTIMLGKNNPALDMAGLWGSLGLKSVTVSGNQVALHFKTADESRFAQIVNNLYILPKHIWAAQSDPTHWTNPNPVGSGPFTEVQNFQGQSYTLGANPHYWNQANVKVPAVTFTQYATQDAIALALTSGAADWATAFIASAESVFDAKSGYNHHYFSNRAVPIVLYVNAKKYPFSLPVFRQALSLAINRKALWMNAEYGYEPPATITGLNGLWPKWQDPTISNSLAQYNPAKAKRMLLSAGFKMKGGKLLDPKGHPISINLGVPTGWTDWIAMQQILAQDFKAIGINANANIEQFPQWFDDQNKGHFDLQVSGAPYAPTPYGLYNGMMGSEWLKPAGVDASNNYGRFSSPAFDKLAAEFRVTTNLKKQHAIVDQMEKLYVAQLPTIPLVVGALWEEYSTRHYIGFPNAANYYADGRELAAPDMLLVFTHLQPITG